MAHDLDDELPEPPDVQLLGSLEARHELARWCLAQVGGSLLRLAAEVADGQPMLGEALRELARVCSRGNAGDAGARSDFERYYLEKV